VFSALPVIETCTEEWDDGLHLVVSIRASAGAPGAAFAWEQSQDLIQWTSAATSLALIASEITAEGFCRQRLREVTPLSDNTTRYFRIRITGP
jgi:hypothetical protein